MRAVRIGSVAKVGSVRSIKDNFLPAQEWKPLAPEDQYHQKPPEEDYGARHYSPYRASPFTAVFLAGSVASLKVSQAAVQYLRGYNGDLSEEDKRDDAWRMSSARNRA